MIVRIFVALHITMQYHKNNNVEKKNIEKNEKEAKKNARPIKPYPFIGKNRMPSPYLVNFKNNIGLKKKILRTKKPS